ncbi:hypothetical protein ASF34_13245 [Methylobacterium sp. Leaf106]|nr:hypothetical protein ASF34_13245 [Methylobacterium sp. Leaf106]
MADVGEIKTQLYPPLHAAFRGEMMRFVLGALRVTDGQLTSREIADHVMVGRGLDKDDPRVAQMTRKRVGACLWKSKQAGNVRGLRVEGDLKGWVRA